jgi:hypothetical protein
MYFIFVNRSRSKFEFEFQSYLVCKSLKELKIEKRISIFSVLLGRNPTSGPTVARQASGRCPGGLPHVKPAHRSNLTR